MKYLIFLTGLLTFLNTGAKTFTPLNSSGITTAGGSEAGTALPGSPGDEASLQVWCCPDLYGLTSLWAEKYGEEHPGTLVEVIPLPPDRMNPAEDVPGGIGFVTKAYLPSPGGGTAWRMVLGRDVIVPVMNPGNPWLEEIRKTGISREKFLSVMTGPPDPVWGGLLGNDVAQPVKAYWVDSGSLRYGLAAYLQADPAGSHARLARGTDELLDAIRRDPFAMGFCRLADILDADNNRFREGLALIPVDLNGNGRLDYLESIYGNPEEFGRGVWIGKYPREFCGNIYCTAPQRPSGREELAFLGWVLGEGQQYLSPNGFTKLLASEQHNKQQSLYAGLSPGTGIREAGGTGGSLLIVLAGAILLAILALAGAGFYRRRRAGMEADLVNRFPVFNEQAVIVPGGLYFDRSHTWTFMEKDGSVRIGLDDFLQHVTGRITKIRMKHISERVKKRKTMLSVIQDGKQLEVYSPVSGVIREVNEKLLSDASVINRSPYMDGWIYRVEPDNWQGEIRAYLMGEKCRGWLKKEFSRLKDFIATTMSPDLLENSTVVMQEGGELRDNLMENLGPLYWEKFQTEFLDASI